MSCNTDTPPGISNTQRMQVLAKLMPEHNPDIAALLDMCIDILQTNKQMDDPSLEMIVRLPNDAYTYQCQILNLIVAFQAYARFRYNVDKYIKEHKKGRVVFLEDNLANMLPQLTGKEVTCHESLAFPSLVELEYQ